MGEPRISVVTPFFNTDAYLAECIESVLGQQCGDFEYILANNCSTDGSRDIAQRYANLDRRVRLVDNKTFLSQVQNYNNALRHISPASKYCKIVQADDWIFPECLGSMVRLADAHPTIGIVGAYGQIEDRVYYYGLPMRSSVFQGKDVCRRFWADGLYVFGSPTCVMYRSDLVRARVPFFDESSPLEDADVCFELLKNSDFGFVHQVLTFTRRENESIMTAVRMYDHQPLLQLMTILRHGETHLEASDFAQLRDAAIRAYHRSLGTSLVLGRASAREFWRFHRQGMESCGFRPSWPRIAGYAALASLDLLLNPKKTAELLSRRWRSRLSTRDPKSSKAERAANSSTLNTRTAMQQQAKDRSSFPA